jgi:hypothetical protein
MFSGCDYEQWLATLEQYSKKYLKYGSLLPAQVQLLGQIFDNLDLNKYKVVSFTAPPASGKTHVIALCAAFLCMKGFSTCIVTPNGELKSDFAKEMHEVDTGTKLSIPIESISSYRKKRSLFDFVLVDEAHNLRSSIEIDDSIVKSFHFEEGDELFDCVTSGIDQSDYVTKELGIETSSEILRRMLRFDEFKKEARYLLKGLTRWRTFYIGFQKSCYLKFLLADPQARSILPKGRLFLFSATRLDEKELTFYCNIPSDVLKTVGEKKTPFVPKKNVSYNYAPLESDADKISAACKLLNRTQVRSLILLNNNSKCLLWKEGLAFSFSNRLIVVQSGLSYAERMKAFKEFEDNEGNILVTSSNVYWEGITVKNLKLLLIPYNPFPQPTLIELAERKITEYNIIAARRLIQGLGRIGRQPQETGSCMLLFHPSRDFRYIKQASLD